MTTQARIEQTEEETFAQYIRRLGQAVHDGEASWGTLTAALDEAADEIELLEAERDRIRYQAIQQNYVLGGK